MKCDPKIIVRKIGDGFHRIGAKVKFATVTYCDREGNVDSRKADEFHRLFERCK